MSDHPESMPWTIKNVPADIRQKAVRAAKQAEQTMGEWITDQVNRATDPHTANQVIRPGRRAANRPPAPLPDIDLPGLASAINATVTALQAAGEEVPKGLGGEASKTIRAYMRAARGLPERQTRGHTVGLGGQTLPLIAAALPEADSLR
jgi:hypothetical protein